MDEITEYRTQGAAKAGLPSFGARFRSLFSLRVPCLSFTFQRLETYFAVRVVLRARNRKRRQRESSHERY
jgi:hypothetical protein